jgi:hypothetical protein
MIGWGADPHLTEFGPDGSVRFDATLPRGGESYRVFRFPWHGVPHEPPVAAAGQSGSGKTLFVSWNGSTALAAWRLETGRSTASLFPAATVPKQGFETALPLPGNASYAVAVAVDGDGGELARTAVIAV